MLHALQPNFAMLIVPDRSLLGDGRLSKKEALDKLREENNAMLNRYRLPDQDELSRVHERLGRPMPYQELIRRVLKLNPTLWVEDSINMPGHCGFYRQKQPKFAGDSDKEFLVAFPKQVLPEFSSVTLNHERLVTGEIRGWRTVLLRLLQQGALTLSQVQSLVEYTEQPVARRWNQEIVCFKQTGPYRR